MLDFLSFAFVADIALKNIIYPSPQKPLKEADKEKRVPQMISSNGMEEEKR